MSGGLPTGSLIPPNGDPDVIQLYQNERYATESRIASAPPDVRTIPIIIPYIFPFRPEGVRTESIREKLRERLMLVASSYPDKALQITGVSFKATSNFWAPVAVNFSHVAQMPGQKEPDERVLHKTTVFDGNMVTAVIPPNGAAEVDVFSIPPAAIVRPHATRARLERGRGIKGMLAVVYPDYDPKIMGAVCRKVPKNSHLGLYLAEAAAREPTPERQAAFLSKMCAEVNSEFYAVYSVNFQEKLAEMAARERLRIYLDDVVNEVHDFAITVMPQVQPLGSEVVDTRTIAAQNPLISVSLMNTSNPDEEINDRWNNKYMVSFDCVFHFAAHPRE
jgi:hypothetical protein